MATCLKCGRHDELRFGYCWNCANEGDLRLGRRTVMQHLDHAAGNCIRAVPRTLYDPDAAREYFWRAKIDTKCAWERFWRTGDYRPGGEWHHLLED